jgi:type IV pilus assembly protein PilE
VPAAPTVAPTWLLVGSGYYQLTIPSFTAATATAPAQYTITATAVGDQLKDTSCYQFSVTQSGLRTAVNSGGTDNTSNCW